jgi:tetratricopeptide (TPR) repeat protein
MFTRIKVGNRACPCLHAFLILGGLLIALLLLAGCGTGGEPRDPSLEGIPVSRLLDQPLNESYQSLAGADSGDPEVWHDVDLYWELKEGLFDRDRRAAATDRLFSLWEADPRHVLWPEIAVINRSFLDDRSRLNVRLNDPAFADTSTAVGIYLNGLKMRSSAAYTAEFRRARNRFQNGQSFPAVWIRLKSAYRELKGGFPDTAVAVALESLPDSREIGGWRLEAMAWRMIANALLAQGELDDALHAVVLADKLATASVPAGGSVVGILRIRELRARILAARREIEESVALFEANYELAMSRNSAYLAARNLSRESMAVEATGDRHLLISLGQRGLNISLADNDSLNVPRQLMNLAYGFRMLGELDSCLVYQQRAEKWVAAYPAPLNVARMPLMQAEYYAQIGDFAVVDSLLRVAASHDRNVDTAEARTELHLNLIRGWMEIGRPDLVYRSIEALGDLGSNVGDVSADRHVVADLNLLIGQFLTNRGEYVRAAEALDKAETALASRGDPTRSWKLARDRGLLARRRGNLAAAERFFRECVDRGMELEAPEHESTGRLLLGSVHLERGRYAAARAAFPSTAADQFVGRFTTRVSALLLTGISYAREGEHDLALQTLAEARGACLSWSPPDLKARIDLETGLAHAGAGRIDEATRLYETIATSLERGIATGESIELAYFNGDLRRDLVEAAGDLPSVDPETSLRFADRVLPGRQAGRLTAEARLAAPQVVYFVGKKSSCRWIVGDDGVSRRNLPGENELNRLLAPVLADMAAPNRVPIEADVARLADVLLGGVAEQWPSGQTLAIVPDLSLFGVPWAALPLTELGVAMLDHGPVSVHDVPFTGSGVQRNPLRSGRLLAVGTDDAATAGGGLAALRHAEREARDVAAVWPAGESVLSLGDRASLALTENDDLVSFAAIHVASHARIYEGRSDQAVLLLAGVETEALSVPAIRALDLDADLVFLSCCEAGDGQGQRSGNTGLARGFLDAGARHVVAPLIVIEDQAARSLATSFYAHWLAGAPVPQALRAAQRELRDSDPRWSHPFYWGFYQVNVAGAAD